MTVSITNTTNTTNPPTDPTDAKVIVLKTVQPGDLIEVVKQLRRYMATADTTGHLLYASFANIDPEIQEHAERARRHVESTANRLYALLQAIEKSPTYLAIRKEKYTGDSE